ncbi:FGGY family carbohydrate kinase [Brachybacterium paraconglomeratum]|uniref:FGGY family carbohydrate kinase n=1 Tax=Brachybacterium paraconglomeratum TaxID=173362 RepID=UPI00026C7487|nr:FGGY family carbohydrate kinase [Brachybacterium paraconglomeratum]
MPHLLCLDLGTSAAKAALLDLDGTVHLRAEAPYPTRHAADGTAEQDPRDWERAARAVIVELLEAASDVEVAAFVLTGQMQDLVPVPRSGAASIAILYSDTRAGAEAEELRAALAADGVSWDALTGNLQDATSCAAMHLRLLRTAPEQLADLQGVVFGPAGYLVARMGLGLWCDPTTAATTGLLEARTRDWSPAVARAAGLDPALLPALTGAAGQVVGHAGAEATALLGVPDGLPVVLAPGDAGVTTSGIVGLAPGDAYVYLGTSGWLASVLPGTGTSPTGAQDAGGERDGDEPDGVESAGAGSAGEDSAGEGAAGDGPAGVSHHLALGASSATAEPRILRISALLSAGAAADWARQALLDGADPAGADELLEAREQERGRGPSGLLALPSIVGERFPVRDASLRGAVVGIDAGTRGIDLYASLLEGVAHGLAHGLESEGDSSPRPLPVTGGGASSAPWLRILADVTGRPVRTVDGTDAALLGCALVAAEALGLDHALVPLGARQEAATIVPDPSAAAQHAALRPAHRALYDAAARVQRLR